MIVIGIDTGVNTGVAVWDCTKGEFLLLKTTQIHRAFNTVLSLQPSLVRVEDARKRKWFGKMDAEQMKYGAAVREGSGSAKRDAKIWEDFLRDNKIPFELVAPKDNKTKRKADEFKRITGWTERTNEHSRDAGGLVHGFTERNVRNTLEKIKK